MVSCRSLLLHGISGSRLRPISDRSGGSDGAGRLMLLLFYDCFWASISPEKDTSKEGLFDHGVLLIPYESILRSMCPSEKAMEVHASVERSESFALGKRFAVAKLTASLSPRAKLQPRLLSTYGRLFRHPRSKLAPTKISWFLASGPAWKKANCRLSHPFLIIRKIGCPFPLSLRRRKASLTIDLLQQGEPSDRSASVRKYLF